MSDGTADRITIDAMQHTVGNPETFIWPVRVYYEDTDASGVAYHANYLRWFERARTEWMRELGRTSTTLAEQHGAAFTLMRVEVDYLRPARLDDALEATVFVAECKRASVVFGQSLRQCGEGGTVLANARVRVVCVDAISFRPRAWPDGWMDTDLVARQIKIFPDTTSTTPQHR